MTSPTSVETWHAALAAVGHGMSYREAILRHEVGSVTGLRRRYLGQVPVDARRGPKPKYLTKEAEIGILEAITFRARRGMCLDMAQLCHLIRDVAHCLHANGTTVIPVDFPNQRWAERFVKRHPSISMRKGQLLDHKRHDASTVEVVEAFYFELEKWFRERSYPPECIYNADETGVNARGSGSARVICPKGLRANTQSSHDRENVSLMGCCSASGWSMPPMYIFAGKYRKPSWLAGTIPGSTLAVTDSSMMQRRLFKGWLDVFIQASAPARGNGSKPAILLLDGHFSHIDLEIIEVAKLNNIGKRIGYFWMDRHFTIWILAFMNNA